MSGDLTRVDENKLPPLAPKMVQTLMAMITTHTDEEAIRLCPYSTSHFYRIKPALLRYKEAYLQQSVTQSLDMLKALSPKSVAVLGEQLDLKRNEQLRNKAANDILDKTLPKKPTTAAVTQVNINLDKYMEDAYTAN